MCGPIRRYACGRRCSYRCYSPPDRRFEPPLLITDPAFYLVAVPAVILFGIAKGGFGGGLGVMAVPLMALVVSPVKAAAILLPILCVMDLVSLRAYRGRWVLSELRLLLPASLARPH